MMKYLRDPNDHLTRKRLSCLRDKHLRTDGDSSFSVQSPSFSVQNPSFILC